MELNELKAGWKNAGGHLKSEEDLLSMTKVINHPAIKKIKTKLVIQVVLLLLFLFVYYDWFDGNKRPLYANLALVAGLLLYILNDVVGYVSLTKPVGAANLKQSVMHYLARVKRLFFFSVIVACLYSISIILFFTSTIIFTKEKGLVLMFCIVIIVQVIVLSSKIWSKWIKSLKQQIKDFNLDDERQV